MVAYAMHIALMSARSTPGATAIETAGAGTDVSICATVQPGRTCEGSDERLTGRETHDTKLFGDPRDRPISERQIGRVGEVAVAWREDELDGGRCCGVDEGYVELSLAD